MRNTLRLSLHAWRRLATRPDARGASRNITTRRLYPLVGVIHSSLARIQALSHAEALSSAVIPPPLFLLGFWRSGTTFLHELFCCDPRFGFPSTYACLNPSHFLLTEKWARAQVAQHQVHRPMDSMTYSWISPQEDEFALFALGSPSPYQALLLPSLMREPRLLLDLREHSQREQDLWKEILLDFLRLLTVQQGKRMVLKSPPHGFRLPLLPDMFPEARYVVIERNPYEVFASNLRLWQTLLDMYSLESWSADEVEAFVLAAYIIHEDAIAEGARFLGPGVLARIRYEDLVADPVGQMARLYSELELGGFDDVRVRLEQHVAQVVGYKRNQFKISQAEKARLEERWGHLIREKGYWTGHESDYIRFVESVPASAS